MKIMLTLTTFFLFIYNVYSQTDCTKAPSDIVLVGDYAPNFIVYDLHGDSLQLSNLKGKVVLINYFATWCPPCREEMPRLQAEIWEKYKSNPNFELLVISRGETKEKLERFAKRKDTGDLPIYPDEDESIFHLYATNYIPRNYIINEDGKVVYKSTGFQNEEFDFMVNRLAEMLDKDH